MRSIPALLALTLLVPAASAAAQTAPTKPTPATEKTAPAAAKPAPAPAKTTPAPAAATRTVAAPKAEAPKAAIAPKAKAPATATAAATAEHITVSNSPDLVLQPYNPFIDTRLTFVFADDNVLASPGQTKEPSPGPQFHATGLNKLFFENYDTAYTGFETLTHLVLYKHTKSFFHGLSAEAAMVLALQVDPYTGGVSIGDSSSYVTLDYRPDGWGKNEKISFTGFPMTSDRFRLGYSYRITWGGSDFFLHNIQTVPGARVQVIRNHWYAWVGAKSTVLNENIVHQSELATEQVSNWGALAGAGVDITPHLRLEANGGYFTRGTLQTQVQSLLGTKTGAGGATVQIAWHVGRPVGTSIDLQLYKNDPEQHQSFFHPAKYGPGVSYVIKSEVTYLVQTLVDPDNTGSTKIQSAKAGDINFAMQFGMNRIFVDAVYQDLQFILFNVPSFVPYETLPKAVTPAPEMFAAVGYDRYLSGLHLTPGLRVGVKRPAYVVTNVLPTGVNPPTTLTGTRTVVVRDRYNRDVLKPNDSVLPIIAVQGTARWDLAETMAVIAEVSYQNDPNRVTYVSSSSGETFQQYENPNILGFNVVLQARF